MPIYFLCDINNAFLSMHAVYNVQHGDSVDLREIPAVIGGSEKSRHGIVLAKSNVAKKYGITTAMTLRDARNLCPNLVVVPPRYDIYVKASRALMGILNEYSDQCEQYSIDEMFICFKGFNLIYDDYVALAHEIKERVFKELGFTINIGISTNKLLAKMASNIKKPNLVHTLWESEVVEKMHPLDIRELHGIGAQISKKLRRYGINTIGEIANSDPSFLEYILKSYGRLLYNYSWGIDCSVVNDVKHTYVKSIGNSSTSSYDIEDAEDAFKLMMSLSETIGMRLRNLNMRANLVSVAIKNTDFIVVRKQEKLHVSIAATNDIIKHSKRLFMVIWDGKPIRHIEVRVGMLTEPFPQQLDMFSQADDRGEVIDNVIDELRSRFGRGSIIRGALVNSGLRSMMGGLPNSDVPTMRSEL